MDDLRRMAVFAAVVEQGSLSAAARALGSSTSAISQQLRRLGREGGVTLLHRTTRRLALTEAGERFHAECAAGIHQARRPARLLRASGADLDHPVHPHLPETAYLKCLAFALD